MIIIILLFKFASWNEQRSFKIFILKGNHSKKYKSFVPRCLEGVLYPFMAFLIFSIIFSTILYFFGSFGYIKFKHTYDYLWLGMVFASFVFLVPLFKNLILYFLRKEFNE